MRIHSTGWTLRRTACASIVGLLVSAVVPPADAQNKPHATATATVPPPKATAAGVDEAASLFRKAIAAHDAGQLHDAEALFLKAWALKNTWDIAANLAFVEIRLGKHAAAAQHLTFAARNVPPTEPSSTTATISSRLEEVRGEVSSLRIRLNVEGADVRVGGQQIGKSPLAEETFVLPGSILIEVAKDGFEPVAQTVETRKGETKEVVVELKKKAIATRSWAVIGAGAGLTAVSLGVAIGLGAAAKAAQDEVEQKRAMLTSPCPVEPTTGTCSEITAAARRHDGMVIASIGLFITAGLAGSATLLYSVWPRSAPATVSFSAGPQGATFLVAGSF